MRLPSTTSLVEKKKLYTIRLLPNTYSPVRKRRADNVNLAPTCPDGHFWSKRVCIPFLMLDFFFFRAVVKQLETPVLF